MRVRHVQLAAAKPQDRKFLQLAQKYNYGPKKQADAPAPDNVDDYEV